jgi:hypothetical protein
MYNRASGEVRPAVLERRARIAAATITHNSLSAEVALRL